jgi:hypothetical protein
MAVVKKNINLLFIFFFSVILCEKKLINKKQVIGDIKREWGEGVEAN